MTRRSLRIGLSIGLVVLALSGCGTYGRMLQYRYSGVDDHQIFAGRVIERSEQPFVFRDETQQGRIPTQLSVTGLDAVGIEEVLRENGTLAFLVIQGDTILYEHYFNGAERDRISLGFSMTKSVLSLLIGCAIEDGLMGSVDDPVTQYLPELRAQGFDTVTLRHLLMSTSGVDYAENDNPFGIHAYLYYCEKCLEREAMAFELAEPPGTRFVYKSGDNILLATALRRVLGEETITAYLQRRVWDPLGMEYDGLWSTDGVQEKTWCCLAATARDFAKFGLLYLNEGEVGQKSVINADWIHRATIVSKEQGASWRYQYQWWHPFRDRSHFMMAGHLGQYVYVNPDTRVVVVRLGRDRGKLGSEQWWELFANVSDAVGKH